MTTTPTGGDPASWARRLQLTRAVQWFAGNQGDPYALILRAEADDPTPYEKQVGAHGPLFYSVQLDTWVTANGSVAQEVLADNRFGRLTRSGQRPGERLLPLAGTALDHDQDVRRRLGVLTAFGGPVLRTDEDGVRLGVEKTARTLLDGLDDRFDLAVFARRLVALTLADLLGIPAGHQARFEDALTATGRTFDSRLCPQTLDHALATAAATGELTTVLGEVHAARPAVSAGGGSLSDPASSAAPALDPALAPSTDDQVTAALALAVGTAEPATTLLCNAVQALMQQPRQWAALAADPGLAPAAIDEILRLFPPVRLESRVAHEDVTLAGHLLPAESHLVILIAAAHRDLAAATDPALGLQHDPHFAESAPLIRLIAGTALHTLAETAPTLRPAGEAIRRRRSPVLHSHARLPVTRAAGGEMPHDDRPLTEEAI
ncbi:P450-derived glycosyltransferase activator [Streptomyces sp. ACA25]|uniref:cytochrome P450 family protein n=1 Tax=Streptomyces sp. ACA25 TaxID=3022596 RepID=UPI002307E082|nr:P450-derived glycosyltransferase activator [Streptomyces sp. ACA25]MDB1090308.1 P450-derived glycosyltransferase activator [Streptomyces sp. ACA25]